MRPAVWGLVRAGAAVVAGVGLTYAAVQVPWTTSVSRLADPSTRRNPLLRKYVKTAS